MFARLVTSNLQRSLVRPRTADRSIIVFYSKVPRGFKAQQAERKIGFVGYIFLVVPATTFCLGVWQYNRRQWKFDKIAELDQKVKRSDPISLPENLEECSDLEYMRVKIKGKFDNSKEIFIGPRSLLDVHGGSSGFGVISSGDKVGWHVVTPFQIEGGPRILINRGWIPRTKMDPAQRKEGQLEGTVELIGILRHDEETSSLTPPNKVESDSWYSRDISALASRLNTEKVFLDLDGESSRYAADRGGPVGGQTRISLRNDHVQYMLTWWGITLATSILWAKRFIW